MIVNVLDLVGQDIRGLQADIRHRRNGKLIYAHQDRPEIVRLERAYRRKRTKKELDRGIGEVDWLRLEWDVEGLNAPLSCGYSGSCGSESVDGWQIELLEEFTS